MGAFLLEEVDVDTLSQRHYYLREKSMRLLILTSLLFIAACGQTGPLYLPGKAVPSHERSHGSF
jgi:predicted small lipoprotein YifL